jgi:hypothetical protein
MSYSLAEEPPFDPAAVPRWHYDAKCVRSDDFLRLPLPWPEQALICSRNDEGSFAVSEGMFWPADGERTLSIPVDSQRAVGAPIS